MRNEKGFSLIELLIVVAIIGIIAAIAIPNLVQSRAAANEASAISSVRTVVTAQITFAATQGDNRFANDLGELETAQFIDEALGSGTKDGYNFAIANGGADSFDVSGDPVSANSGRRSFCSNETGVIRWAVGACDPDSSTPLGAAAAPPAP